MRVASGDGWGGVGIVVGGKWRELYLNSNKEQINKNNKIKKSLEKINTVLRE